MRIHEVGVVLMYGTLSVSMTFFNKAVLSVFQFGFPGVIMLLQASVGIALLRLAHMMRWIHLPKLAWSHVRIVLPLTFCWWIYVSSGVVALKFMSVPMFSTLRKITSLIVLIGEWVLLGRKSTVQVWIAVVIMTFGGLLAGATDLEFNPIGYTFVMLCAVTTALYLLQISSTSSSSNLDTFGLMYYNNILSLPLTAIQTVFLSRELPDALLYPRLTDPRFIVVLSLSVLQATFLNVAIFFCTRLNSPLATSVTGQVKDVVTVLAGFYLFGEARPPRGNILGLTIALVGSFLYSAAKLHASQTASRTRPPPAKKES